MTSPDSRSVPGAVGTDLQDMFLDGYQRTMEPYELATLRACAALTAVRLTVWSHMQGDTDFERNNEDNLAWLTHHNPPDGS